MEFLYSNYCHFFIIIRNKETLMNQLVSKKLVLLIVLFLINSAFSFQIKYGKILDD